MWIYEQSKGRLLRGGIIQGYGYSGAGEGKNNPEMQAVHDVGPIPVGLYIIGDPFDSPEHGPFCLPLAPEQDNEMFGRSGFLMHGDSIAHPGQASKGCIIMPHATRVTVYGSGDKVLQVVASLLTEENWTA